MEPPQEGSVNSEFFSKVGGRCDFGFVDCSNLIARKGQDSEGAPRKPSLRSKTSQRQSAAQVGGIFKPVRLLISLGV